MKTSGIYKIVNKGNGKYYVGSSVGIEFRWKAHISSLKRNVHKSPKLQAAWNKYGMDNFIFMTIETCEPNTDITQRIEQKYLDIAKTEQLCCYNTTFIAYAPMLGRKHSRKTRNLISKMVNKGYLEGKMRWNKGKKLTDEHKKRVSEARIRLQIKPSRRQRRLQSMMVRGKNNYFYRNPMYGEKNGRYISTKFKFYNIKTGEIFFGTRTELIKKFNLSSGNVCNMMQGKLKSVKGWIIHNYESPQ